MKERQHQSLKLYLWPVILLVILFAIYGTSFVPIGYDFFYWFKPIPEKWLTEGVRLYADTPGFFNPPWIIWMLLPLALLPVHLGMGALIVLTILIIAVTIWCLTEGDRWTGVITAAVSLAFPTLALFHYGQVETFSLAGTLLGYYALRRRHSWILGIALLLLVTKLNVGTPIAVVYCILALRWPWREYAKMMIVLTIAFILTFPMFGFDWPARYIRILLDSGGLMGWWGNISPWELAIRGKVPLWVIGIFCLGLWIITIRQLQKRGLCLYTLGLLTSTMALTSPRVSNQSHLFVLATAFVYLATCSPKIAAFCYLFTFLPLLRIPFGLEIGILDSLLPFMAFVLSLFCASKMPSQCASPYGTQAMLEREVPNGSYPE